MATPRALDAVDAALAEARWSLAAEVRSARSARRLVESALEHWGCVAQVEVVKLLVSELVTNSVIHARSGAELVLKLTGSSVRVEVVDNSPVRPVVLSPSPDDTSGRGMNLVETLSSAWGVRTSGAGKTVWFEVARVGSVGD